MGTFAISSQRHLQGARRFHAAIHLHAAEVTAPGSSRPRRRLGQLGRQSPLLRPVYRALDGCLTATLLLQQQRALHKAADK